MTKALSKTQPFQIVPTNVSEAMSLAKMIADSDLVPKDFKGKPGNVLIAMQMGAEVGLNPMQACQNIAVINGRPSMWGDALLAICQSHPSFEWIKEYMENGDAVCIVKRKGYDPHEQRFGDKDVVTGGYDKKQGPWQTNRARMKQMRARGFCLRDTFADALKGMVPIEEAIDMEPITVTSTPAPAEQGEFIKDHLTTLIGHDEPAPVTEPEPTADEDKEPFTTLISSSDRSKLYARLRKHEVDPQLFKDQFGLDSINDALADRMDEYLAWIENVQPEASGAGKTAEEPKQIPHGRYIFDCAADFLGNSDRAKELFKHVLGPDRLKTMKDLDNLTDDERADVWDKLIESGYTEVV